MAFVVAGRVNKQIAAELGLSLVTVKVHRGQVMRKMLAKSVAETGTHGRPARPARLSLGYTKVYTLDAWV